MSELRWQVSIPTDEGFVGRECANPECARYFRVHMDSFTDEMYCPYCGTQFDKNDLMTGDQLEYLQSVAAEKAMEYLSAELGKAFSSGTHNSKYVTFKPGKPYRAKSIEPQYEEHEVDSEIVCPECESRFQVDGIFAHCVGCGTQHIAIFDANLEVIRGEVSASSNSQRILRHAYNDLVSMFESITDRRASNYASEHPSFQDPFEARRFFKKQAGVDMAAGLDDEELLVIRRVFQKRHAWQHGRGLIDQQYVRKVPEDAPLVGTEAQLSMDEFEAAAQLVRRMLDVLPLTG